VAWLGETLTLLKVLGIALICAGVVLVSRSAA
jgi:drug/metabolite transporter (DMT)-like permease